MATAGRVTPDSSPPPPLRRIGYAGLLLYATVAFALRNHQTFVDEGSNLNLGWCVLQGMRLYRDLFENHFPLPVYLSAAIVALTGTSLPLVRLAVFAMEAAAFFAIAQVSGLVFPVGFAAAVWALVSSYYFGNLLLYDNLAAIGSLGVGAICFAALTRRLKPSAAALAFFAALAILLSMSSPFGALTALLAIAGLWLAPSISRRAVALVAGAVAIPSAAYFGYLWISGGLRAFLQYVIVFNSTIYQRYAPHPLLPAMAKQLFFLGLFDPVWFRSLHPLQFNAISFDPPFDQWIFSGFFYRAAALAVCATFAFRKDYRTALLLYLFVASLPLRLEYGFHASPLAVFCLFLVGVLIEQAAGLSGVTRVAALSLVGAPALLLSFSGARYVAQHAWQSDFSQLTTEARLLRNAAKGRSDVRLGHYPAGNYMLYLAGLRPVSKFTDYYPWVADLGRAELDADLAKAPAVLLRIDIAGNVWGYANRDTLAAEITYARTHLVQERAGSLFLYVTPSLATGHPASSRSPFLPGLYRDGEWRLASDFEDPTGSIARIYRFGGQQGDLPVTGDWDGSGKTKIGIYRPSQGQWFLDYNGNGFFDANDKVFRFGAPDAIPVTGDWDGSRRTRIGVYLPSSGEWRLDIDGDGAFHPSRDRSFTFGGAPGDRPVTGDWTASGADHIGVVSSGYRWRLDLNGNGKFDPGIDAEFYLGGIPGDIPITGDWTGDGKTKAGVFRQGSVWVLDINGDRRVDDSGASPDLVIPFGRPGDRPVTGKW